MIKLAYIYEYVTLAETLNFSKTAELTYIAQPALSRHIAKLEEEMGAKLFERTTRTVKLTPAGEAVLGSFREMIQSFREAQEQAAFLSAGKVGILKVSSPYYWTEDFSEPIVLHFLQEHPKCDIRIASCQPLEGLQDMYEGRSDITISILLKKIESNIQRVPFAKEPLGVVFSTEHPLAGRDFVKLDELRDNDFIFLGLGAKNFEGFNTFLLELLAKREIYPRYPQYTQQIDTLGMSIKRTGGVSIMPYGVRNMNRSYLRVIPLVDSDCVLNMCMYYRTDNENILIPQFVQAAKALGLNM